MTRRIHWISAATCASILVCTAAAAGPAALGKVVAHGRIELRSDTGNLVLDGDSMPYFAGDKIATGTSGSATLELGPQAKILVEPGSLVSAEALASGHRIRLEQGLLRFAFGASDAFEIHTAFATATPAPVQARSEGPVFSGVVMLDEAGRPLVQILRGALELTIREGQSRTIGAGEIWMFDATRNDFVKADADAEAPAAVSASEFQWGAFLKKAAPYAGGWAAVGGAAYAVDELTEDDDDDDDESPTQ